MSDSIIWLHDYALSTTHPIYGAAPKNSRIIYIWDENYLKRENYSLKRLVFIYETLCSMSVEIILGDTDSVIRDLQSSIIYFPSSPCNFLTGLVSELAQTKIVKVIPDEPFVALDGQLEITRFFSYWNRVKNLALSESGIGVT